jgi:hypothetical protein
VRSIGIQRGSQHGIALRRDPAAIPLSGADRYATAAAVAASVFISPVNVGVASRTTFADAGDLGGTASP